MTGPTSGPTSGGDRPPPDARRVGARPVLRGLLAATAGAVLLGVVLPRLAGTRWSDVGVVLHRMDAPALAGLAALWLAGLWCYAHVLTGSVPGLRTGQAITVNVCGSAVSNLLPFGGAAGLAVTFGMTRSWGFPTGTVAVSAVVTGIWNVLAKLVLPLLALLGLLMAGQVPAGRLVAAAATGAALLAVALALVAGGLADERVARALAGTGARAAAPVAAAARRVLRRPRPAGPLTAGTPTGPAAGSPGDAGARWRAGVLDVVRGGWLPMTLGLAGFLGCQAALLQVALTTLGSTLTPAQVFAGYAFGRLLSTLVVTPGGLGITETGVAALLVGFGGDPAVCTTGVLVFSAFAFFAQYPAGAVGAAVWAGRRSWRRPVRDVTPLVPPR